MDCLDELGKIEHSFKWDSFRREFEDFCKRKMREDTERELRMGLLKIPNDDNPRWRRYREYLISIANGIKRESK